MASTMPPSHDQRGIVVPVLAVEDAGAGEGETVAHMVSVTLRRLRRLVRIEPAMRAKASTKP